MLYLDGPNVQIGQLNLSSKTKGTFYTCKFLSFYRDP